MFDAYHKGIFGTLEVTRYPLVQAVRAHEDIANRRKSGPIILIPCPASGGRTIRTTEKEWGPRPERNRHVAVWASRDSFDYRLSHSDLRDAISMEKRYFTSDLSIRS